MLELTGKFIGSDEIVSTEVTEHKTPQGSDIVLVSFSSGYKKIYPVNVLDLIVTDVVSDATTVQQKKFDVLIHQFMAFAAELDVDAGEIESLSIRIANNINETFNRASNYLWNGDDTRFVAGFDPMYHTSLLQAHKVLTSIPTNESKG